MRVVVSFLFKRVQHMHKPLQPLDDTTQVGDMNYWSKLRHIA